MKMYSQLPVTLLLVTSLCNSNPAGGQTQMNPNSFDLYFSRALSADSQRYIEARQAILDIGAAALPQLQVQEAQEDWRPRLLAEIVTGWMNQRALFEECTARVKGKTKITAPSMTGKTPRTVRVKGVQQLGPAVVPRLLEMLLFTRDYAGTDELETIFAALAHFKEPRTVEPLMHLVGEGDLSVKIGAAGALGRLNDARAVTVLAPLVENQRTDPALRSAAAISLARIGRPPVNDLFRRILANDGEDIEMRRQVAYLSGLLGPSAAPALTGALETSTDERLLVNALGSLSRIGARDTLPAVRGAERKFPTGEVNQAAREARKAIEGKSRGQ